MALQSKTVTGTKLNFKFSAFIVETRTQLSVSEQLLLNILSPSSILQRHDRVADFLPSGICRFGWMSFGIFNSETDSWDGFQL